MDKQKIIVNYSDLLTRVETEEQPELRGKKVVPPVDPGVDYSSEYRKQTGRDFETGEIVVQ